jgi:hypothetical protein
LVKENPIKNWKLRCNNWLQVCHFSLEIKFAAKCNGGDWVCNEVGYYNNDCWTWNLVGIGDVGDDKMALGNLEDGIEVF